MLRNVPAPILVAYIEGLRKMLSDGDEAEVMSAIQSLDFLDSIPPELHAGYVQSIASIAKS